MAGAAGSAAFRALASSNGALSEAPSHRGRGQEDVAKSHFALQKLLCASSSFDVFTKRKHMEKPNYMHNNPVDKGRVNSPDQWPWSSFRFYYLNDSSLLSMDRVA